MRRQDIESRQERLAETAEAEGCRIDRGRYVPDDLGQQFSGPWSDAEAMTGEANSKNQARNFFGTVDDGHGIRRDVDHPTPSFHFTHAPEGRKIAFDDPCGFFQEAV